jgi:hypothetical protein
MNSMLSISLKYLLLIATLTLIGTTRQSISCPNCKDGFAQDTRQAQIGESYSLSVLFMLLMMTGIGGGIAMKIAYHTKKTAQKTAMPG